MMSASPSASTLPQGGDLPDEEETLALILPSLARFLARDVRGDEIDRDGLIPSSVRDGAGALGLFGLTLPVEYGGAGLSLCSTSKIVTEIARVDRSVAIMIGLHAGLGTRGLVEHGSPALKSEWLPKLASGACIASFAATEASAGSDLMAIRTTGESTERGLRIDGEKSYVTNGGFAGLFTALVRTPGLGGERAFSLVAIPRNTPGVEIGHEEHKLGIRGSSTVTVRFDGAVVPFDHVLGDPGRGTELAYGLLAWGRSLMSAGCVGNARAALDATLEYVGTRRQFGRSIGAFGATQAHVAWMAARVRAMEAFVASVGREHARGDSIDVSSTIAKVFTSESAFAVCDRAVQLHGALGFLESTGVARMLRDCRITRIFEGANDVLLVRLGAARLASREPLAVTTNVPELVALGARFSGAVVELRARLGLAAMKRQLVLQRVAQAEIALRVALVVAESGDALGVHAAHLLAEEGMRALDTLASAERDEMAAEAIAKRLYER
jgi:alkylation response protein AidB-like acyl-CoA dehydrogenase